jgi:hypothetical protein
METSELHVELHASSRTKPTKPTRSQPQPCRLLCTPVTTSKMAAAQPPKDEIVASRSEILNWWLHAPNHAFPNPTWPDDRMSESWRIGKDIDHFADV